MKSWLYSPWVHRVQLERDSNKIKKNKKITQEPVVQLAASSLTRGRNWSKSYYRILQRHWRPNPPWEGRCWCSERGESGMREQTYRTQRKLKQSMIQKVNTTMAACSSTPYNSSVRAVLRKHSSASLCFSPLRGHTHTHTVSHNNRNQVQSKALVFQQQLLPIH